MQVRGGDEWRMDGRCREEEEEEGRMDERWKMEDVDIRRGRN
jgi:hypothetical protein